MALKKESCHFCGKRYEPYMRAVKTQTACKGKECEAERKRQNYLSWIKKNPGYSWGKRKEWAQAHPNYWRDYRQSHPKYVERDNNRRKLSMRKQRCSANQITLNQIAEEKLRQIQDLEPAECSAKQITLDRRVDGIMEYLFWAAPLLISQREWHSP